jgi:hypothetical protein
MKKTQIICIALLLLLFGIASQAPRMQPQQKDNSPQEKFQQQRLQSRLPSQKPPQVESASPVNRSQQQYQQVDRRPQERTRQSQSAPDKGRDQSGVNQQQPDARNQNIQHPQEFDKNKPRPAFDQRHPRQDGANLDGRNNDRSGYRQVNRRDHYDDWQGRRARDWRSEHRTWEQRGGYHGYRIPDNRFGRYFGPRHFFRIHDLPVLVLRGYPRFQYGGYWFSPIDPWPEYWTDDWYETDDVYILYGGDGYYLFNRRYPGVGIAVSISM